MYTILIVDDDIDIRNGIEIYLKNEGYDVLQANDGEQAVKLTPCDRHYFNFTRTLRSYSFIKSATKTVSTRLLSYSRSPRFVI